jgi:hypothetical protein
MKSGDNELFNNSLNLLLPKFWVFMAQTYYGLQEFKILYETVSDILCSTKDKNVRQFSNTNFRTLYIF